jgi:hypothetical protein
MSLGIDAPPVADEHEGLVLMTYHLAMAATYFEVTPENTDIVKQHLDVALNDLAIPAALAWLDKMEAAYPKE